VWSTVLSAWVVAAETARGGIRATAGALLLAGALMPLPSHAGPQDGHVTSGSASISQAGATTTITQSSQNVSLTWSSFNTLPHEKVNFVQPSASAIAVNRILDINGTQFLGSLNANGQVYLINPNGVLFGAGAQVNVGGLVASTLNLNDAELSANQRSFSGGGTGQVVNQGMINTSAGGYVALIGNTASNQGTINTPQGTTVLGAGNAVTLTFQGNQLLKVVVDQGVINSLADNGGLIRADGGAVFMSAGAKDSLLSSVVSNSGVVQARTVENRNGTIVLLGGMSAGTTLVGGTLDASAPDGGNGGFIETSAAYVKVADGATVTTLAANGQSGTWLIDPVDFTIAASGGDMSGATLSSNLGSGNVTIQSTSGANGTAGDVNVNDAVSWSTDNTLTLNAQNNININADITASGASGRVALEHGQSTAAGTGTSYNIGSGARINLQAGNNFSTKQGSSGTVVNYTVITSLGAEGSVTGTDLQGMTLTGRYVLGTAIDASATSGWNSGAGFMPIGTGTSGGTLFNGTLDGLGHTISGLSINRPGTSFVGLFGSSSGTIRNLGLLGGSVSGGGHTGALVGWHPGTIINSYTTTNVTGNGSPTGGLAGTNQGTITFSYATGTVTAGFMVGGLVGWNQGLISNSYATGAVNSNSGSGRIGGLVGSMLNAGRIANSFATGNVTSTGPSVGGLLGYWDTATATSSITNSYATGSVSGTNGVGGLIGAKSASANGSLTNSYATGGVSGTSNLGGLVGLWSAGAGITSSFWDTTTTGQASSSGGGLGMTTAQMQQQTNFTSATAANGNVNPGWDFTTVWRMYDGHTYPLLKALMKAAAVTASNASKTYDTLAWSGGNGYTCATGLGLACNNGLLLGSMTYGGTAQGAINAGTYTLSGSGLYSSQLGYDISYASGTLTVNPASLSVSGVSAANKVYDATTAATLTGTATVAALGSDVVTVGGTGAATFADKNVGTGKAVTVTGYILGGTDAGNYIIVQPTGLTANITPANLSVSGVSAANKVYDATTGATLSGTASVAALGSDVVTVSGGSGAFTDKNVGTGKAVTVTGYILGGADAGNYIIVQPTGLTANITPANLAVTGVSADNKVYDATTAALLNGTATVTALGSDTVTVGGTGSATFADADVGSNKPVAVTGYILAGADAGNYIIVQPSGLTASITAAPAAVTSVSPPVQDTLLPTANTTEASSTLVVVTHGSITRTVAAAGHATTPAPCTPSASPGTGVASTGRNPVLQVIDGGVCAVSRPLYANK
jgi:filamentous hemagglutinin family protein